MACFFTVPLLALVYFGIKKWRQGRKKDAIVHDVYEFEKNDAEK